jgi:hypothetical protein
VKTALAFLALVLLALGGAGTASALEVRDTLWGFDGQIVPGAFNPLSVLIANPSSIPFNSQIILNAQSSFGSKGGTAASCYLGPRAARWVQFFVFFDTQTANMNSGWTIRWGRGPNNQFEIDSPKAGAPASVWLIDPEDAFAARDVTRMKRFSETLFPPTVSGTNGLDLVALDHAPRWETARRVVFLDWLRRGGVLHLLPDSAGRAVEFADELAILNAPLDRQTIGAGLVVRHRGPRETLMRDNAFLKAGPPPATLEESTSATIYDLENSFFQQLVSLSQAKVNWGILYLLTFVYFLLVGPVHFGWAKHVRDYRISLLALGVVVTAFAFFFGMAGRRGQGERARISTLSWARLLDGNRYDVMQWSNAFVTSGGVYTFTHPAAHNLYSSGSSVEQARGFAVGGPDGYYEVDMPLFSSSALLHQGTMTGDSVEARVTTWQADGENLLLSLALPPGFPPAERFQKAWARWQDRFYPLEIEDGALVSAKDQNGMKTADFLSPTEIGRVNEFYRRRYANTETYSAQDIFNDCARALIARSLGGTSAFQRHIARPALPDDQAQLFILAGQPEGFRMKGISDGSEAGMVLYQQTLTKPRAR